MAAPGCSKKPAVTVEQVYEQQPAAESEGPPRLYAPRCPELPKAVYPEIAEEERPDLVSVRVDLVIDETGRATHLRTTVDRIVARSEEFAAAARRALDSLVCEPAVQMPYPGSEHVLPVPVEYASTIVYRFYRDQNDARAAFR